MFLLISVGMWWRTSVIQGSMTPTTYPISNGNNSEEIRYETLERGRGRRVGGTGTETTTVTSTIFFIAFIVTDATRKRRRYTHQLWHPYPLTSSIWQPSCVWISQAGLISQRSRFDCRDSRVSRLISSNANGSRRTASRRAANFKRVSLSFSGKGISCVPASPLPPTASVPSSCSHALVSGCKTASAFRCSPMPASDIRVSQRRSDHSDSAEVQLALLHDRDTMGGESGSVSICQSGSDPQDQLPLSQHYAWLTGDQ